MQHQSGGQAQGPNALGRQPGVAAFVAPGSVAEAVTGAIDLKAEPEFRTEEVEHIGADGCWRRNRRPFTFRDRISRHNNTSGRLMAPRSSRAKAWVRGGASIG